MLSTASGTGRTADILLCVVESDHDSRISLPKRFNDTFTRNFCIECDAQPPIENLARLPRRLWAYQVPQLNRVRAPIVAKH